MHCRSALTMNIAGVVKDWLLIGLSVALFHSAVSGLNLFGYLIAFLGVCWYNYRKLQNMKRRQAGLPGVSICHSWSGKQRPPPPLPTSGGPRRLLIQHVECVIKQSSG